MGCVVKINHPCLSAEERAYRIDQIKKTTIEYMREVINERNALKEKEGRDETQKKKG